MSDDKRENYRATPVRGTDLVMHAWTEGSRIMTRLSWPPHGIDRPLGLAITLSADEMATIGDAYNTGMSPAAEALIINVTNALIVQCGILRKMQAVDPGLTVRPLPSDLSDET